MSVIRSQIYYINSSNRVSGTSSNFTYTIDIPDGSNFDSCLVLSMSIPLTYYTIRVLNNFFTLQELGSNITITIPRGNYDARTFATTLTGLLNSGINGWIYSISLDMTTAKYTYSVTGNSGNQPSFIFTNHLVDQMGFDDNSTNTFVSDTLTSTEVLNFVSTNCLYLHSDLVDDQTSILQEVYSNNTIPYSYIIYNCLNADLYTKRLRTNASSTFNFSLTDIDKNVIDLNGEEIAVTLMLYKKLSLADMFKKYLQIANL